MPSDEPQAKRGRGRPQHVPTAENRQKVEQLSAGSVEQDLIAASIGISTNTLIKHYANELLLGRTVMDGLAMGVLAKAMMEGGKEAVTAAKWWTESRMGFTRRVAVDDGGLKETPIRIIVDHVGEAAPVGAAASNQTSRRAEIDMAGVKLVG